MKDYAKSENKEISSEVLYYYNIIIIGNIIYIKTY